jgi:hypothetical protein
MLGHEDVADCPLCGLVDGACVWMAPEVSLGGLDGDLLGPMSGLLGIISVGFLLGLKVGSADTLSAGMFDGMPVVSAVREMVGLLVGRIPGSDVAFFDGVIGDPVGMRLVDIVGK